MVAQGSGVLTRCDDARGRGAQIVGRADVRGSGGRHRGAKLLAEIRMLSLRVLCVCVVALSAACSRTTAALTSMMPAVSPPSAPPGYLSVCSEPCGPLRHELCPHLCVTVCVLRTWVMM